MEITNQILVMIQKVNGIIDDESCNKLIPYNIPDESFDCLEDDGANEIYGNQN